MNYIEIVKENYYQWATKGYCEEAETLNKEIGEAYFDTGSPHFFTGDVNSKLVLIHLNPKRGSDDFGDNNPYNNFNDYWFHFTNFGKIHYGIDSQRKHRSPFDHKQIRFLKPFNILPFKDGDKYHNLEVVIDNKLQIELIPYGSPDFNYSLVGTKNIEPFFERIIYLLLEKDRKYIIFCGKVFTELLKPYIVSNITHTFKLTKISGEPTKDDFNVICIKLQYKEKTIKAVIAPQFAKQGYPVTQYGEMVKTLYNSF